jgi:hypothetical protein
MKYEKSVTDKEHIVDVLQTRWKEVPVNMTALNHVPWIDALFAFLQKKDSGFVLERWKADHGTLLSAFKTRKTDDLKSIRASIRYLLNAAWRRRIDFPEQTDETARTCKQFCDFVLHGIDERLKSVGSTY